jgi:hypothetical protein
MKRFALIGLLLLAACSDASSGRDESVALPVDVDGATYPLRRFIDNETGVACYLVGYHAVSCVKVR